jgi:hypothetical protein
MLPLVGRILARNGPAIGPASQISYTVDVALQTSDRTFENVTPNHRRPAINPTGVEPDIGAAQVGDSCLVQYDGFRFKFLIFESVVFGEECA